MTNEEREDLNTFKHDLVKQARWWQWKAETLEKENEQLKAENAALRERLEKAVELPVKVGDIVCCVEDEDEDGDYIVEPTVVTKKNIYLLCSRIKGNPSDAFLLQKAAEEWCKELKGEKE